MEEKPTHRERKRSRTEEKGKEPEREEEGEEKKSTLCPNCGELCTGEYRYIFASEVSAMEWAEYDDTDGSEGGVVRVWVHGKQFKIHVPNKTGYGILFNKVIEARCGQTPHLVIAQCERDGNFCYYVGNTVWGGEESEEG